MWTVDAWKAACIRAVSVVKHTDIKKCSLEMTDQETARGNVKPCVSLSTRWIGWKILPRTGAAEEIRQQ